MLYSIHRCKGEWGIISFQDCYWAVNILLYWTGSVITFDCGERLFTRAYSDRTKGNAFRLKDSRFVLDLDEKFYTHRSKKKAKTNYWKCWAQDQELGQHKVILQKLEWFAIMPSMICLPFLILVLRQQRV